jgi:AcrR family transcriptional regulator
VAWSSFPRNMGCMPDAVRADARRNRERIVAAASACFAQEGMECQMSVIAKVAGVGSATVFRHFPAKRELAVAVMEQRMAETEELLERELENPDATRGLRTVVEHFVESMVSDRGLKQAALGEFTPDDAMLEKRDEIFEQVDRCLERAKEQGGVRPDIELVDLIVLTQGIAQAAGPLELSAPGSWRRFLALGLRGVLTEGAEDPLPPTPADAASALEAGH